MGKRIAIIISAILFLSVAVMGYFLLRGKNLVTTDPYVPVSGKACFIIETVDLRSFMNSLTTGKGISGEAGRVKEFAEFNQSLRYIADNVNKPDFRKLIPEGPAVISFYSEEGRIRTLLSMAVPDDMNLKQGRQILSSAGIVHFQTLIGNRQVAAVPYSQAGVNDTVFIAIGKGLLLIGSSSKVMKQAFITWESGTDIRSLGDFSKIWLASGKSEDKIFIVFKNCEEILRTILPFDKKDAAAEMLRFAAAAGGDVYLSDDGFSISGYAESNDTSVFFNRLKNIQSADFRSPAILPSATALFETVAIPGTISLRHARDENDLTLNAATALKRYFDGEVTRAYIDIRENRPSENIVMMIRLNNPGQAEQAFIDNASSWLTEKLMFTPDDEVSIPVYKTAFHGITDTFLPGFSGDSKDTYVTFFDNFMITGSSFATISRILYDNLLNNTLANDVEYRDFESSLPSRANYFLYFVPGHITAWLESYLNEDIVNSLRGNKSTISRIRAAGYKLSPTGGMLYNSLSVRFRDESSGESLSQAEWETLLDTVACTKPFFFTNHLTGAKEIFVQDLHNNVYLINAAGRVLWKVPLDEKINGPVYMIDYYGNGKFQLLFAGKKNIHLLDRNGNYVERYPVRLRSPAAGPLALFDYDNNRNYRLVITGEDRYVYAYDKSGNTVKGWTPFRTSGIAEAVPACFQVAGKDYIAICDASAIYLLDRYGSKRVTFREPVARAAGSSLKLNSGSESFLICSGPNGIVQQIYFDGKITKINLGKFSPSHIFDIFDLDGDGFDEYLFIDRGILYLYDHNRKEMFSRDFASSKLSGAATFSFTSADRKIGIFDAEKNLIYLIGKDGETMKGFPLKGASMFSIGRLTEKNAWNLIVGSPDRFLYNYKIETDTN